MQKICILGCLAMYAGEARMAGDYGAVTTVRNSMLYAYYQTSSAAGYAAKVLFSR